MINMQSPEDTGQCNTYDNKKACLDKKSMFDSSKNLCAWTDPNQLMDDERTTYLCNYVQPVISWKVIAPLHSLIDLFPLNNVHYIYVSHQIIALVCVVIGVISCPVGLAVDHIFERYVSIVQRSDNTK